MEIREIREKEEKLQNSDVREYFQASRNLSYISH